MAYLKLKKDGFHITRNLLDHAAFNDWWEAEGKPIHYDMMQRLRARWFFGGRRVRRRLYRAARRVFDPLAPFAIDLEHCLDELPEVVAKIGVAIRRRGHRDLFTVEESRAIVVIPRGIVRNDYDVRLVRALSDSPHASAFPGLVRRLVRPLANEAEGLLFAQVARGRDGVGAGKNAVLLDVDNAFRWRINGTDGHYYVALNEEEVDFSNRRARRRFRSDVEEMLRAQEVFLRRMDGQTRQRVAEPFRLTKV